MDRPTKARLPSRVARVDRRSAISSTGTSAAAARDEAEAAAYPLRARWRPGLRCNDETAVCAARSGVSVRAACITKSQPKASGIILLSHGTPQTLFWYIKLHTLNHILIES